MVDRSSSALGDNPLSSAEIRYGVRVPAVSAGPGPAGSRPFGLRFARVVPTPVMQSFVYCHARQVAVGEDGLPLIETRGKEWETKGSSEGEEGPEEIWDWEEK